jgi:hypothetical protein
MQGKRMAALGAEKRGNLVTVFFLTKMRRGFILTCPMKDQTFLNKNLLRRKNEKNLSAV